MLVCHDWHCMDPKRCVFVGEDYNAGEEIDSAGDCELLVVDGRQIGLHEVSIIVLSLLAPFLFRGSPTYKVLDQLE